MKIILGNLKDKADELVVFLEPRVGTKPKASGSEIEIEDGALREGVKPRHVKTYVKRYLFQTGQRKAFRVLVEARELRLVELEREEEEEEKEEQPPKPAEEKEEKEEEVKPKEEKATEEKEEEKPMKEEKKETTPKKPRKKKKPAGAG